jgi:hypothetical protein
MDISIISGLIQNTALLLAFSMIWDYSWVQTAESKSSLRKIITGIIIGIITIILMLTPWIQVEGLVFDTRSVLLSLTGLFFGIIPSVTAVLIALAYRIQLGGPGVLMGISVIILSTLTGLLWRHLRPHWQRGKFIYELVFLGFTVHLLMLGCTLLLPGEQRAEAVSNIILPLLTIYPAATVLLGSLMLRQYTNWENRKAADKLRESDRRFSEMIRNTSLFSVIVNPEGKVVYCNERLLEAAGYKFEEITGLNLIESFIPEESVESMKDIFGYILQGTTGHYNYETEIKTRDESRLIVSWNATILKDEEGKVTGVACIGENITMRKNAEIELIKAKNKAEESDKLKSIFLANMSHEIRTPMNAIMGFSAMLGDNKADEADKKKYIEIIRSSGDRLLQIINDIIDISKLEAGQMKINLTECDAHQVFNNSFETFRKSELLSHKPGIQLRQNIIEPEGSVKFTCDPNRLQQVLDNLLSNAIKYTEAGVVEAGFRVSGNDDEKALEFYVKDTGFGIPDEMSGLIFDRFRQVEERRYHEGAGLGLSISRGIVELLGGRIWFKSKPEEGSTFFFTVPMRAPQAARIIPIKESRKNLKLEGKTVIIAEDDYNSFYYLRLLLKELKATVHHAENGQVLMRLVRHSTPDLILLDINMPVMSGLEALELIKKEGIKTRIIAQTAYAMPDERERCMNAGCDGYISKPVRKNELFDLIGQVMAQKTPQL